MTEKMQTDTEQAEQVFHTRQFMAGNSPAVRIPVGMAFAHQTELVVTRRGESIVIQPKAETLEDVPALFAALRPFHDGSRPDFAPEDRDW